MSIVTTKPRALTLRPHEARRLAEAGEVLIVREIYRMPQQSHSDPEEWWIYTGRGSAMTSNYRQEIRINKATRSEVSRRDYYISKDELLMETCPLGPVGSMLWGRESFHVGLAGDWAFIDYRATVDADQPMSHPINGELFDRLESKRKGWRPASHMPIEASRFPHLRHEACEVAKGRKLVIDHPELGDDAIAEEPTDDIARIWRNDLWAWCSTVRNLDHPEQGS